MSKKEFITVLAITLIVALVWVVSDLVHTRSTSKDLPEVKQYLEPIDPDFDKQTIDKISNLSTPAPAPSGVPLATPAPTIQPTPLASSIASPSASASASASPR